MSKRQEFLKRKNLSSNLKKYNAFSIYGYYPLFSDIETAKIVSPLTSYHIHEFEGVEYYMPEGLEMGVTQFHGDWAPEPIVSTEFSQPIIAPLNGQITPEVPEAIIQLEEPEIITPPDEPEEETPPLTSETGY